VTVLTAPEEVPADAVLLDVRWQLGDASGRERYQAGHLPGAVYVDLETELAGPATPGEGRHPLPSLQSLQSAARRWGLEDDSRVVVYDATGGLAAARAWWLLRWGGLPGVTVLDGGLAAWTGELETGDVVPLPGTVVLTGGGMPVLTADEAAALAAGDGVLLDARAAERFRGEVEPVDPRAGHVPGAVSAPTTENLTAGRFVAAAALRERFAALGVTPGKEVGVYCGSGVTAAHEIAALAEAGIDAALWPGSWSQWSNDPERPVATGP
jgi:thiosulfate/3-mercaptopyruvate sulfurtransferase